jgi:hypothetical protein
MHLPWLLGTSRSLWRESRETAAAAQPALTPSAETHALPRLKRARSGR